MMSQSNAVVFGITSNLMFAAINVIIGIEKHNPGLVDNYIIYHLSTDDICENDRIAARKITNKIQFRIFEPEVDMKVFGEIVNQYSLLYFCKFCVFDLLNEYDSVLWLDADLLIKGDISSIFESKGMAWRVSLSVRFCDILKYPEIEITEKDTKPNAGVIFVKKDEQTKDITTSECWEIANNIRKYTKRLSLDEMTFGVIAIKHGIQVVELPRKYNLVFHMTSDEESIIQHAMGKKKFWNNRVMNLMFEEWRQNNSRWLAVGGTPYNGPIVDDEVGKSTAHIYRAFNWLRYWAKVLPTEADLKKYNLISGNYYNNFVQFYIKDVNHKVHYELVQSRKDMIHDDTIFKDENVIRVCIHIENEKYLNDLVIKRLEQFANSNYYQIRKTHSKFLVEKDVLESQSVSELYNLAGETYDLLFSEFCRIK